MLMQSLLDEMNRNRELLTEYERIGPAGMFGAAMIKNDIRMAERAISEGDVVAMLQAYEKLKESQ